MENLTANIFIFNLMFCVIKRAIATLKHFDNKLFVLRFYFLNAPTSHDCVVLISSVAHF